MKSLLIGIGTLAVWAAAVVDASAGWDNVYQPTLFGRWRQRRETTTQYYYVQPAVVQPVAQAAPQPPPVVAYSAPAAPCPQNCNTSYVQRCFYQPVTTYETRSYYEPVTTMQTSYYYEPVTSYRTSYYFDSCRCSYYQVATPVVTQELRAKSCPVQSWVQRQVQVPVVGYQKACYWQPQTTCCTTTNGALIPIAAAPYGNGAVAAPYGNGGGGAAGGPPNVIATPPQPQPQMQQPPQIRDEHSPAGPTVGGTGGGNTSFSNPQSQWQAPANIVPQSNPQANPKGTPRVNPDVKLERIVYGPESFVEGQVVRNDNTPRPNASILFVSADNGKRETVTANNAGRFQVNLASGNWLVYVRGRDGAAQFHSQLNVQERQTARITVMN